MGGQLPMLPRAFLLAVASFAAVAIAADKPVADHSKLKTKEDKANAANWPDNSKGSPTPHAPAENPPAATTQRSQQIAPPAAGTTPIRHAELVVPAFGYCTGTVRA